MGTSKEQEDLELFPIYERDLIAKVDDVSTFPIFASEILVSSKKKEPKHVEELTAQVEETEKGESEITKKESITKENYAPIVPNGLSVLDALKLNGKYPKKKDEQKNVVPDMFIIDKATKGVPAGENVLFACYTYVAYCSMAKVKPTKNLTLKLPFSDNPSRVFVITDSSMVLSSLYTSEKEAVVVSRKDVAGVVHIFEKKLGSVGQTQIMLNNGNIIVITIYKVIGGAPDQKQFDDFKEKIDGLLGQQENVLSDSENDDEKTLAGDDEFENGIRKRKSSL